MSRVARAAPPPSSCALLTAFWPNLARRRRPAMGSSQYIAPAPAPTAPSILNADLPLMTSPSSARPAGLARSSAKHSLLQRHSKPRVETGGVEPRTARRRDLFRARPSTASEAQTNPVQVDVRR